MKNKYGFCLFENAISKKEIAKIKKSSSKFSEAKTLKEDGLTKEDVDLSFRDSSVSFSNDAWIYTLLFPFIEEANENSGWKYEIDSCEPVQIAKYGKDQHYSWHQDGASDHNAVDEKVRKLSLIATISNGYEGGELEFKQIENDGVNVMKPSMSLGAVIIFPSYQWHRSTPVTKGTKQSLAMWCLGPPFR